ncbi:hypothetical protein [Catenuloplanes indicus]|uniref:Secreted protein n=1 Tax=Catenuloplanes indicus TaxID=137267 RepID=A0AAE3W1V8_9ACTN|nr:hypothetical protein [Catenuloplanes indicus]MDQ0367790.1 hypothetical protein [Catenuloplanes indicus]
MSAVLRSVNQVVADRRGRRPVLRTLVISGIAGAAWLLSAAAAHAAEPETPTEAAHRGPGVLSLVNDLGTGVVEERAPSLVGELLTPAALPMDHLLGNGISARTDTAMPARQPAEPNAPAHTLRTLVTGDGAEREPVASICLIGGPAGSTNPALRHPAAASAGPAGQDGSDPDPGGPGIDSVTAFPDVVVPTPVTPLTGVTAASTAPTRVPAAAVVTGMRLDSEPGRAARSAPAEPLPLRGARTGAPEQPPAAPLPIGPVKGTSGGTTGAPTGGSVVHTDGGSSAVSSAAVMGTMGAASRPTAPADVVVPRRDAEAPTISPD